MIAGCAGRSSKLRTSNSNGGTSLAELSDLSVETRGAETGYAQVVDPWKHRMSAIHE